MQTLHADAKEIANLIRKNLWDEQQRLPLHSYHNSMSDTEGFANAHAYLSAVLLDLYGTSRDTQ